MYETGVAPRVIKELPPSTAKSSRRAEKLDDDEDTFATFLTATEEGETGVGLDEVLGICVQREVMDWEEALKWGDEDGVMWVLLRFPKWVCGGANVWRVLKGTI